MKLKPYLYYYCKLHKQSATMQKIRRYCSVVDCPHLGQRKRKNYRRKRK